jgi:hypothetical protein
MGTSAERIQKTYGHLLPDASDFTRSQLDAFDAQTETYGQGEWTRVAEAPSCPSTKKAPRSRDSLQSGRRDLNSGPLVPQASQSDGGRSVEVAYGGSAMRLPPVLRRSHD